MPSRRLLKTNVLVKLRFLLLSAPDTYDQEAKTHAQFNMNVCLPLLQTLGKK